VWPINEQPAKDEPPPSVPEVPVIERTHIVVDGDTLQKLAGRYLDDPSRSWEIYQLNQDMLRGPELLPIGSLLKIPPREPRHEPASKVQANPPAADSSNPASYSTSTGQSTLVPLRVIPLAPREVPHATLLDPQPLDE
jgi:hypothetical protein